MRFLLRSLKPCRYRSYTQCGSRVIPGVTYRIHKMSLGRRIELAEAIRDLAVEREFHQAGESPKERVEAAALSAKIDRVYLSWGLVELEGLVIDGQPPSAEVLYSSGPEDLLREIVDRIKLECGLTDEERKN